MRFHFVTAMITCLEMQYKIHFFSFNLFIFFPSLFFSLFPSPSFLFNLSLFSFFLLSAGQKLPLYLSQSWLCLTHRVGMYWGCVPACYLFPSTDSYIQVMAAQLRSGNTFRVARPLGEKGCGSPQNGQAWGGEQDQLQQLSFGWEVLPPNEHLYLAAGMCFPHPHSWSLTEMGGGSRNFSSAHTSCELVSMSTAMGQEMSSMQCRHRLFRGYSCSISFCQAYMCIDIYAPTLNGCCMPWCIPQSLPSKSAAPVDLWFLSRLYIQISFSQQPRITEFLGDVCLFLDRLEWGLKPEVLSQLEYPEQLEAVLMPLPVGTKESN